MELLSECRSCLLTIGRVGAGIFHDFHNARITEIRNALNGGIPPPDYYVLSE